MGLLLRIAGTPLYMGSAYVTFSKNVPINSTQNETEQKSILIALFTSTSSNLNPVLQ